MVYPDSASASLVIVAPAASTCIPQFILKRCGGYIVGGLYSFPTTEGFYIPVGRLRLLCLGFLLLSPELRLCLFLCLLVLRFCDVATVKASFILAIPAAGGRFLVAFPDRCQLVVYLVPIYINDLNGSKAHYVSLGFLLNYTGKHEDLQFLFVEYRNCIRNRSKSLRNASQPFTNSYLDYIPFGLAKLFTNRF